MKLKNLFSLGLAMMLTVSVLAGCGSTKQSTSTGQSATSQSTSSSTQASDTQADASSEVVEESKGIVFPLEETMKFTTMTTDRNTYYTEDNLAWKALQEYANFEIEVVAEFANSEMAEKGGLIMQSGDYPDFLFKCSRLDLNALGMEGVLIPLEDLIREYAPTLTAILDARNAWSDITASDGHVYSLPNVDKPYSIDGNEAWYINQRWLDNVGLEEPTNLEELYTVLKAFKEQDANGNGDPDDEIPFVFSESITRFMPWMDGITSFGNRFALVEGEFAFYPVTDTYKEILSWFAKMYDEGLLLETGFTMTSEQVMALTESGDVSGIAFAFTPAFAPEENHYDYVALNAFDDGGLGLGTGVVKGGFAITDKCENPEELIAWADYFYTEEGGRLFRLGIEDVTYVLNEDGSYRNKETDAVESALYQVTLMGNGVPPCTVPELYYNVSAESDPKTAYVQNELYGENGVFGESNGTNVPKLVLTEEENEVVTTYFTNIKNYVDSYTAQVITGQLSLDDSWQEYLDTLKKMSVDEVISAYAAAYDRVK